MQEKIQPGYTRVTEALYPFSGLSTIPKHIVDNAARRGTEVHDVCECITRGLGDWGVTDETQPYVDSFDQWWNATDIKPMYVEKRFYCNTHKITGKIDMIAVLNGEMCIIDYKTPAKPSKTWPLQGSAYWHLCKVAGIDVSKVMFLHLKKDGSPPTQLIYDKNEKYFEIYKCCLKAYLYFQEQFMHEEPEIDLAHPQQPHREISLDLEEEEAWNQKQREHWKSEKTGHSFISNRT